MKKIRILIIEDNRVLREGLTAMLNAEADLRVVSTVGSGNNILLKASQSRAHVILLDVGLKNFNELSVVESVRKRLPGVKVIGMGFVPSQSEIVEFIEAGASGFLLKDATTNEFVRTIRSVSKGVKVLPPPLTGSLFSHIAEYALKRGKGKISPAVRMTKREREVIALIAEGLSNKEIAQRLSIAIHTVKSHVRNVMEKLALHSRLQIAKYSREENT